MSNRIITVKVTRDHEQNIWYATSDDVSGLHVCSEDLDELGAIVDDVLPDLIKHNLPPNKDISCGIPYHLMQERIAGNTDRV